MGCVNKASKEFKDLAAKHNLSSNALELITHKYWLQTGNETLFPTDVYIQAQLGNTSYKEEGKSIRKLWELKYNTPLEYYNMQDLQKAKAEALQYFPGSAVVSYKNAKGNYTLSVKRPVEKANYTKDDFFDDADNMKSVRDIKTLDLGIKDKQLYGIGKVQELYNKFNQDKTSQALADRVFSIASELGLNISFNESLPFGTLGRYTNNNTILFKKSFLERDIMNNKKAPILLHEVIHAISMYALSDQTKNWKRSKDLENFRTEINSIYQDLKDNPILKGERGIVDIKEFVAELANPVFRAKLQEIDKQNKKKQSLWQRILNAFKSLLGLHVTNSYYQRSMNVLDNALNAFDLDTYMRYNGVKNLLRQGYNAKDWEFNSLSDEQLKSKVNDYFDSQVYDEELQSLKKAAIANDTLQDFNRRLERIGYRGSIYNSDSIDAKDKATNYDNAGLDKQALEGKAKRRQSSQNSQDDFTGGQIKTGFDGTNHPRYMDADAAKEFINNMSAKDLRDELGLIKQESADYGLVNGVEEKPKHSGRAVPQDFIFNDGTTVKAPFRPNAQQVDALNVMSDFIKSDETSMTLSGYAGTGKTSLMEMIAQKCRANYRNVIFCASTNKAAAVLNDKVKKAGFEAKTLNKIFGIQVEVDPNSKEYDARNTRNKINEDALQKQGVYPGTTVIIDEASMINEENYGIINRMAKDFGLKIIYVGDSAQLAPVKEKDISKVFRNGDGKVITLTQVERTDDNAILKEATDLRNNKPLSGESSFNAKGEGVAYVSPQNRESINNILSHYVKELKNNPNAFRVLAYTNAVVARYNQQIRHLLGYDTAIPQAGEPMTGYNNWGYVYTPNGGYYKFINSESYKVVKTDKPKKIPMNLGNGRVITMEAIPVILEDSLGKVDTFNFMDVKTNLQNRQAATILANEKKALWAKWRTTPGKAAKIAILGQINAIDNFLFINDSIEDDKGHLLQGKVIDFGYAMTVHKSQGSTFTNVLIDDVDIQKGAFNQNNNNNAANAWEAVDIGDSNERDGSNAEMISSEAVDLFGSTPTETTTSTQATAPKQSNNLVQQLEYVAVSRATDTVTVISNNIKKEGSPLHPEATKSSKTEEHKAPVNLKNNTINSIPQRSDNEITKQVVDHLKSIPGINVLGKNAMAEFLKTHNPKYLQQMTTPQGEVYGFVDKDGNIYLDETKISPEHPIHEYTHLWDRTVQKHNPKLWNRGVELMKQTSLWNEVLNDEHYGKQWQSMNLPKEKLDNLIASEVHSRIVGENGGKLLDNIAKRNGQSGIIAKLKQWVLDMWKDVKATFGSWSKEDLDALTLKDFNHMTVRDFVDSTNLKDATNASYTEQQSKELKTVNEVWENLGGYFEGAGLNINKDFPNASEKDISTLEDNYMAPDRYPLTDRQIIEIGNRIINSNTTNNGTEEYKTTDEFRRVQEASRKLSEKGVSQYNTGEKLLNDKDKRRLGGILGRLLDSSSNGSSYAFKSDLTHTNKNGNVGHFRIGTVDGKLFHDIFEVVRTYLKNGELVDLHEDYSDCKCFVTDDGLCGFAIEPDGNLVSVFSLSPDTNKGFLHAIKDMVRQEGATHLDAYMSNKQPLQEIYKKTLGFHTAATMDYNMEYDHDDIAKNHGNPQVVFMVDHEVADVKHFDKDSYTEAQQYQLDQLKEPDTNNTKTEEGSTQMVELPGYELSKGLPDAVPVDAEWKISYLKELDAQLYMDKSAEEIDNIINQMDTILQSPSEKEYLDDLKHSKEDKTEKQLSEYDKLNKQIDNLLDGRVMYEGEEVTSIPASEVRHVAQLVADEISDFITELQQDGNKAKEWFPTFTGYTDFSGVSRKDIVAAVGINNLIQRAKDFMDTEKYPIDDMDASMQADLIFDNWDAIMYLAADVFAFNEGFGIAKDYTKGNFTTTEDTSNVDYDNFNDYSNDPDARAEGEKDEQEHWQIESRTIDILNSMSALVRQGLHQCYLLDENGEKVMSIWNLPERVNPRKVTNSILRWCQGSQSLKDMIAKLSEKQVKNPWLSQLLNRLSDKSGNETDFQSQFYSVFTKDFTNYSIVKLENGRYYSMPVNSHPALSEAMNTITTQYKIGQLPLFGVDGKIRKDILGTKNTIGENYAFNFHKALAELQSADKALKEGNTLDDAMAKKATANVMAVCRNFGYFVTEDMVSDIMNAENISKFTEYMRYLVDSLDKASESKESYDPFKFHGKNSIDGTLRNFLTPITDVLEDTAVNAFYDSGKMYQSYVTPSYLSRLFKKFKTLSGQDFEDFIMNEYGSSGWFKDEKSIYEVKSGWRNDWLQRLATDENARKIFDHKVELNFNKHNYMRNMTDVEYAVSLITEYFSTNQEGTAWFRIPMMSNKPSSEFIKFYTYTGDTYKDDVTLGLHDIFLQEVSRIQTVRRRNLSKNDPRSIKNFDTNGRKFCFLPVLNAYLNNSAFDVSHRDVLKNEDGSVSSDNAKFAALLQKYVEGTTKLTSEESTELDNLVDKILKQSTEDNVQSILDKWEKDGILAAAKNIKGIYNYELDTSKLIKNEDRDNIIMGEVRKKVENFLWNDSLASKNILELMIGDTTFYKDTEDLQKRLAQLHAPGLRGRKDATDYDGKRVSDGNYRTVVLKDFDNFISNIVANINEVFDRRIAAAKDEKQKQVLISLKDSLTRPRTYNPDGSIKDKGGKYWNINVADAQGFSSPASYRKKAFIFGKWSKDAEALYQKIVEGKANYTDFETAFQPLKPFVYGKLTKDMGVDNAPIHSMQVPFQAKNSEYLLIMADAILKGEELSRPNLLRAVYRIMEDSEKLMPTKGIDTIQFESAIKSGLQGALDISQFIKTPGGEEAAYTFMKNQIFKEEYDNNTKERVYRNYNTDTFVHELSYDNYCLQQEIPEHFKNHSQAHGSQIRMITPSDLDYYTTDENGNQVENYYECTEPTGKYDSDGKPIYTKKRMKADEVRKEYEDNIAKGIEESINILTEELHLDSENPRERNLAISKILQREILSSPRYGIDLIQACSIDKKTGEFRIPKGDPIQAKRIEQLLNSIIKNRINKQKIAGGPIVQVSNFGTSKQLHIRFNDKQGNLIPLEEEYNPAEHNNMSYKEYLKKNQGGIAYFEVYAPMWDNKLFDMFSNPDGTINIDAIEATDPELLKMISYRIPTEDKYSCAPMKVVGFMPKEAGDAIMLPYELTEIDDSDFDIDKRYVMRKELPIKKRRRKEINEKLFKIASESYKAAHNGKTNNRWIGDQIRMFLDNPQRMRNNDKFMQWLYSQYQKVAFYIEVPTSGKLYRDNKTVDMTFGILTNEMTADKILNPGGFDAPKKMGYMVAAYKNPANNYSWEELQSMSIDDLKDLSYTEKDITFADVQVQFYKQNAAAASLIGVFAVNKVAHATLEGNDIWLDVSEICGGYPFNIAGHYEVNPQTGKEELVGGKTFGDRMQIDTKFDEEGNLIGKTLGSLVSASADAVKDPILNLMNINMTTAGMLNTMLRLGMTFDDAALFLSQNVIERMLNQFNKENLDNYVSLDSIINKWITKYQEKEKLDENSSINNEPLLKEELIEGLTSKEHSKTDYKVLLAFQRVKALTDAMRNPTYITRFNSISSAVGPLIIDNLIMEHKLGTFTQSADKKLKTNFYTKKVGGEMVDAKTIYKEHPILAQFSRALGIANRVFSDMPSGSSAFRECLNKLPKAIADVLYRDKKLLDQFANFYQSYLLIQSGVVDESELKDTVEKFPEEFIKKDYKKKYPNNALIQAIRMNILKRTGKPYLQINITGMDEQQKEELRSAWIDLHKANPELSKKLFDYSFFKAGVGFSPKTFMALVPTYVKERIIGKNNASYIDTYRHFPDVNKDLITEQFILNNLDNNKIAPWKGGKDTHYSIDLKKGTLKAYDKRDIDDLMETPYIKTKTKGSVHCWKYKGKEDSGDLIYELVKPLGNNKEYLEMSTSTITTPLSEIKEVKEDNDPSSLSESSPAEVDSGSANPSTISNLEKSKKVEEIVELIMKQVPRYSKQEATEVFERIKNDPNKKRSTKFLQNVFKQKGLDLDINGVIDEFNKYC